MRTSIIVGVIAEIVGFVSVILIGNHVAAIWVAAAFLWTMTAYVQARGKND